HALSFGKKHLECGFAQVGPVAGFHQCTTDGFAPQGGEVVRQVGQIGIDLLPDALALLRIGKPVGRGGGMDGQPGMQRRFGPLNGGPHGPQGVVKIEGNGLDVR
ncbi:hypothetical protein RZS08_55940, partial [Arthrospira platensis SPKY1]|nr:hypothetical protein [Arthrospira platensis SPKY1]